MSQLQDLSIEIKNSDQPSKRFENSQSFILDKLLTKYLAQSDCRKLVSISIAGSCPGITILSDMAAKDFFEQVMAKQRDLQRICLPNLGLSGNTMTTLIYMVILRAPLKYNDTNISQMTDEDKKFRGCYKNLKVLNIAGNSIDDS